MKIYVILPAGGRGSRIVSDTPKQYLKVKDKEIIAHTISVFQNCGLIDEIVISAELSYFSLLKSIKENYGFSKIKNIVKGGESRQQSVFNALSSLKANNDDLIIVHDAARPLLPKLILKNAIEKAKNNGSVVVAIKAKDTLISGDLFVKNYIPRDNVYYAQTPQIFKYSTLNTAMQKAKVDNFLGTDESMLVKRAGFQVEIVEGSEFNFKITTATDLELSKRLL